MPNTDTCQGIICMGKYIIRIEKWIISTELTYSLPKIPSAYGKSNFQVGFLKNILRTDLESS